MTFNVEMTVGEFRKRRKALGLSQKAIAKILGVSNSVVCDWENGRSKFRKYAGLAIETIELNMVCPQCNQVIKAKECG
jgi:DNA-binding transcriptional regulator YiaG